MSASDAAPLPRLGEVFFDVRGSSRSMRLSWYADTGIAVFSIWQGGMCTGTFRLPIGDLPRMIEILQRGPEDQEPSRPPEPRRPGREPGRSSKREFRTGAVLRPDPDNSRERHQDDELSGARAARHGRDGAADGYWSSRDQEEATGTWSGPGRQDQSDRSWSDYEQAGYDDDDREAGRYERDDLSGISRRGSGHRRHEQSEAAGHRREDEHEPEAGGYGSQRFVPPYVTDASGEYSNDIYRGRDDPLGDPRQGAYRDDLEYGRSQPDEYDREPWTEDRYSDGSSYRLADPEDGATGRHSAGTDHGLRQHTGPEASYPGSPAEAGEIDTQPGDYRIRGVR
jgi:hypothetical protein